MKQEQGKSLYGFGYPIDQVSRMYYWSDTNKAKVIADASIVVFMLTGNAAALMLYFDFPTLSMAYENLPWARNISYASITIFFSIRMLAVLSERKGAYEFIPLNLNMLALSICLPFYFSTIGIFGGFCWYVLFFYSAVGFVVLESAQIIRTQLATLTMMMGLTLFDDYLPYQVRAYMILEGSYVVSMSRNDLVYLWSILLIASLGGMVAMAYLTGAWQRREKDLHSISYIDELTSVMNRRSIMDGLEMEFQMAREGGSKLSLAMLDLDHFKSINDKYGHQFGDRALKFVADELQTVCRKYDLIGRYGGEEFLIVFPECQSLNALNVLDRLRRKLSDMPLITDDNEEIIISFSAGVSEISPQESNIKQLVEKADMAMYKAKEQGRNRVLLFKG